MSQQSSTNSSNAPAQGKQYYDLHTRGLGYLNRTRMVNTKGKGGRRGEPFLACSINALHGDREDPNTSLFDCRVSGNDAQRIVQAVTPDVEAKKKVTVGFTIGDIYAHVYERKVKKQDADGKWRETGETEIASLIKGRLLQITYVKIDNDEVYRVDSDGVVTTTLDLSDGDQRRDGTNG